MADLIKISDSIDTESSIIAASLTAVKNAYDKAILAQSVADSKLSSISAGTGINVSGNTISNTGVLSINGSTGDITGIVRSVNGTSADASGNVALSKADIVESLGYTPLQTAPVTSVNSKTGAVTISSVTSAVTAYKIPYATCSTGSSSAAKVATIANSVAFSLVQGAMVFVKFSNRNGSSSSATLNVNSTGAKSITLNGASFDSSDSGTSWSAGGVCLFVYTGSTWEWV